jgi:NAD(P)-dependent dehydrogenase (short-subunit alcohol dehydrogenase family)
VLAALRAGAHVVATTRFPCDAARRYGAEPDAAEWRDRLEIHALDLRYLLAAERFARSLAERHARLDLLVNNAAQTVRQPASAYEALLAGERAGVEALPPAAAPLVSRAVHHTAAATALPVPAGEARSWVLEVGEIPLVEAVEVMVINALAPLVLLDALLPLLERSPATHRFVVNVGAREGTFDAAKKGTHPHTNMAKAALNMLTRTSAESLAQRGILMNTVDPGWVSDQNPPERPSRDAFHAPLTPADAAARILDPVFRAIETGEALAGLHLKDFRPAPW